MTFNLNLAGITSADVYGSTGNVSSESIESISPDKLHGLCFWLDGQCNTREGKDHSKTYMENLVYNKPQTTAVGTQEYLQNGTGNVWDGDMLNLGTYAYYPYICYPKMTIEAVVKLTKSDIDDVLEILANAYGAGWYLGYSKAMSSFALGVRNSATDTYVINYVSMSEVGKVCYVVGYFSSGVESVIMDKTSGLSNTITLGTVKIPTTVIQAGMGTDANINNNLNSSRYNGLSVGMVRVWNRVLSESEIEANYQEAKKRFGF